MKKAPFAFVVCIEPNARLLVHRNLEEAENALRDYAASVFVGACSDDEIIEMLAETGHGVRIFACSYDARRRIQASVEVKPFARTGTRRAA
jgi:hypothetical protein